MNLDDLFNKHKAVRRVVLLWSLFLITWVVWRVFGDSPPAVSEAAGTALNYLLVVLIAPIVLYFFHRREK